MENTYMKKKKINHKNSSKYSDKQIGQITEGIKRVHTHLHRVRMSTKEFSEERPPQITFSPKLPNKSWGSDRKSIQYLHGPNGERATLRLDSTIGYKPMLLDTTDSSPEFLSLLDETFVNVVVSEAEYATDFICKSPESAAEVFDLLCEHTYVSHMRGEVTLYGGIPSEETGLPSNRGLRIANLDETGGVNIYERGDEMYKKIDGDNNSSWDRQHIYLVRVEFKIANKDTRFRNLGLTQLHEFITNPQFEELLKDRMQFSSIRTHKCHNGPQAVTRIQAQQELNNIGIFQTKYRRAREALKTNISKYKTTSKPMSPLMQRVLKSRKNAAKSWKKRAEALGYKKIRGFKGLNLGSI